MSELSRYEKFKIRKLYKGIKRPPSELVDPLDMVEFERRCTEDKLIHKLRGKMVRAAWVIRGVRARIKRDMLRQLKKAKAQDFQAKWKQKEGLIHEPHPRRLPSPDPVE